MRTPLTLLLCFLTLNNPGNNHSSAAYAASDRSDTPPRQPPSETEKITELYRLAEEIVDAEIAEKGPQEFFKAVEAGSTKFPITDPDGNPGTIKITNIDGGYLVKFVRNDSPGDTSLLAPSEKISEDSEHLIRYVSRQFFDAVNPNRRSVFGKFGMDTVQVAFFDTDGELVGESVEVRPEFFKDPARWLRHWKQATLAAVTPKMGAICGGLQFAITCVFSANKAGWEWDKIQWFAPTLSLIYGVSIATYGKSYWNWKNRGAPWWQYSKNMMVGMSFAYLVWLSNVSARIDGTGAEHWAKALSQFVDPSSEYFWLIHGRTILNSVLNNGFKTAIDQWSKFLRDSRLVSGKFKWRGRETTVEASLVTSQIYYHLTYLLKMPDLLNLGAFAVSLGLFNYELSAGTLLLIPATPLTQIIVRRLAIKKLAESVGTKNERAAREAFAALDDAYNATLLGRAQRLCNRILGGSPSGDARP